jgi:hypothetical protein
MFRDQPPDFIKIDVEGAELRVLKGARRILSNGAPRLLVELHQGIDPGGQRDPGEVVQYLARLGYSRTRFYGREFFVKSAL